MKNVSKVAFGLAGVLAGAAGLAGAASALAQGYGPNGYGPDPDGDSNPAVNTRLFARIGDAAEAALDPPFQVVTFEAPRREHGKIIRTQLVNDRQVSFSKGLSRQLCEGQLYFRYDTQCTYMAAPSGIFAAVYRDDWGRPLRIRFDQPVCAAALALYPTGGEEGERFKVTLQPYGADEKPLTPANFGFEWTKDTFRWRLMAGAFFLNEKAARVDVNIESEKDKTKIVRFLIDDVAFVENDCLQALADIDAEAGSKPAKTSMSVAPAPFDRYAGKVGDDPAPARKTDAAPAAVRNDIPSVVKTARVGDESASALNSAELYAAQSGFGTGSPAAEPAPMAQEAGWAAFEAAGSVPGVNVVLTEDKCVASVLFDDATLRGVGDAQSALPITLPLKIVGGPVDVSIEARGYISGAVHAQAHLMVGGQTRSLVDAPAGADTNFATSDRFVSVTDSGELQLEMTMAELPSDGASPAFFALDSIDLRMETCRR